MSITVDLSMPEPFTPMSKEDFQAIYAQHKDRFEDLRAGLEEALKRILRTEGKLFLSVTSRVKDVDSAYDKVIKYKINNPFEEIKDWCGLRIICYYYDDIDEIGKLIEREFFDIKRKDKRNLLEPDQFGYRSLHYLVKLKKSWLDTPIYKGLEGLTAEIQIRTVLMHAWAEIEHKIQYKSLTGVPSEFRRQLFRLSAKFEEADEQFEYIRKSIASYERKIRESASTLDAIVNEEMNSNVMLLFSNIIFPDSPELMGNFDYIVSSYSEAGLNMHDIVSAYNLARDLVIIGERATGERMHTDIVKFGPIASIQFMVEVASEKFRNYLIKQARLNGSEVRWSWGVEEARKRMMQ